MIKIKRVKNKIKYISEIAPDNLLKVKKLLKVDLTHRTIVAGSSNLQKKKQPDKLAASRGIFKKLKAFVARIACEAKRRRASRRHLHPRWTLFRLGKRD